MKKQKSFKYLGFTFTPIRRFTEAELNESLYQTTKKHLRSRVYIDGYCHDEFYEAAQKVNADQCDLFHMRNRGQICPCQYEIFEYVD